MKLFGTVTLAAAVGLCVCGGARATQYSVSEQVMGDTYFAEAEAVPVIAYDGRYGELKGASISIVFSVNARLFYNASISAPLPGIEQVVTSYNYSINGFNAQNGTIRTALFTPTNNAPNAVGQFQDSDVLSAVIPEGLLPDLSVSGDTITAYLTPYIEGQHNLDPSVIGNIEFITFTYSSVSLPEPATLALFGIGAAGLALVRRRQVPTS